MTEKEKRDLGIIYNPNYDQELGREIIGCKDKCFAYNQLMPSALEKKGRTAAGNPRQNRRKLYD